MPSFIIIEHNFLKHEKCNSHGSQPSIAKHGIVILVNGIVDNPFGELFSVHICNSHKRSTEKVYILAIAYFIWAQACACIIIIADIL